MSPLFTEVQRSVATHKKCAKALSGLRARFANEAAFRTALFAATNCVLLVYKREPAVERLVAFLVSFVTGEAAEGEDADDSLLAAFLEHLIAHHECKDKAVRFRATQMVRGGVRRGLSRRGRPRCSSAGLSCAAPFVQPVLAGPALVHGEAASRALTSPIVAPRPRARRSDLS